MSIIPYILYQMELQNKVGIKSILNWQNSTRPIQTNITTRLGPNITFIGQESEYLDYLINTELVLYVTKFSQLDAISVLRGAALVIEFAKRYFVWGQIKTMSA